MERIISLSRVHCSPYIPTHFILLFIFTLSTPSISYTMEPLSECFRLFHAAATGEDTLLSDDFLRLSNLSVHDNEGDILGNDYKPWLKATPLHYAAFYGHSRTVQRLIEFGAILNERDALGKTPLRIAAEQGHACCVTILLARGATVNTMGHDGLTPLHCAVQRAFEIIAHLLVDHGAKVNPEWTQPLYKVWHPKKFSTPLHFAVEGGNERCVAFLLSKSALCDAQDHDGCTPLHLAAQKGLTEIIDLLISNGASRTILDKSQRTPLNYIPLSSPAKLISPLCEIDHCYNIHEKLRTLLCFVTNPLACAHWFIEPKKEPRSIVPPLLVMLSVKKESNDYYITQARIVSLNLNQTLPVTHFRSINHSAIEASFDYIVACLRYQIKTECVNHSMYEDMLAYAAVKHFSNALDRHPFNTAFPFKALVLTDYILHNWRLNREDTLLYMDIDSRLKERALTLIKYLGYLTSAQQERRLETLDIARVILSFVLNRDCMGFKKIASLGESS